MRIDPAKHCHAKTKAGRPCGGFHMRDTTYCFWHHPAYKEKRLQASRYGGQAPPGFARYRRYAEHMRKLARK
jgi:hypothetical protein